jgi:uncharacterized protein
MGFKIGVTVSPNAKRTQVTKISENEYRVSVDVPPRDGEANQRLLALLAEHFCVPKSTIKILRGHSSRKKFLEIGL